MSWIDTPQALKIIEEQGIKAITLPTLISWCEKYRIGKKMGGRWFIDEQKLKNFLTKGSNKWKPDDGVESQQMNKTTL